MSNATAEQSFSCLRRLKNYFTNKLNQKHLNHRMFLHVHKQLIDQVDVIATLLEFMFCACIVFVCLLVNEFCVRLRTTSYIYVLKSV